MAWFASVKNTAPTVRYFRSPTNSFPGARSKSIDPFHFVEPSWFVALGGWGAAQEGEKGSGDCGNDGKSQKHKVITLCAVEDQPGKDGRKESGDAIAHAHDPPQGGVTVPSEEVPDQCPVQGRGAHGYRESDRKEIKSGAVLEKEHPQHGCERGNDTHTA